jgi:hypothetical protein
VSDEVEKFLLDADLMIRIHGRKDFATIYAGIIDLAQSGKVRTVRQALDEVKRFDGPAAILKPHREILQLPIEEQYCEEVAKRIEYLSKHANYLWALTGGKNPDPADPWLVGAASVHGYTLVTNESPRKIKRIPAACKLDGIKARCIRGPHFLLKTGLVAKAEPEHIDPDGFFSGND